MRPSEQGIRGDATMRRLLIGIFGVVLVVGLCGGESPTKPEMFTGKVVRSAAPKGKDARGVELKADDGTAYTIVEDDASRMLFLDGRLRDRPVRLTAVRGKGNKSLQIVSVQTVKGGTVYDVDYWCEICQISGSSPGACVCCGDDVELRERPAR
jgi:hypothetical protein